MPPETRAVTRHLRYAWIEFGHSADGIALDAKLKDLGWRNLLLDLPLKKDRLGAGRRASVDHPMLPIRFKGNALLCLPNDKVDGRDAWVNEVLYADHRAAHGDADFVKALRAQNEFLGRFVVNPGVRRASASDASLTDGTDATDFADLVAISGHGSGGTIWGGNEGVDLRGAVARAGPRHASRLKYVLIPTCYNLSEHNGTAWLPLLHNPTPIHGVLGYSGSYPGGNTGGLVFGEFGERLKKRGTTVLQAFRGANKRYGIADRWGAVMHEASLGDTMADWLAGTLKAPPPDGKVVWLNEANVDAGGEEVKDAPLPFVATHVMDDGREITPTNGNDIDVGLFPGKTGVLEVKRASGSFRTGDVVVLTFYYYRPNKDGMDLPKLLVFEPSAECRWELLTDHNKLDRTTHEDALRLEVTRDAPRLRLPYRVHPLATDTYHRDGDDAHGMFWCQIDPSGVSSAWPRQPVALYQHGAWLRPRR